MMSLIIKKIQTLLLFLSFTFFSNTYATKLASVDITEIFKEADIVVLVDIKEGKLLQSFGQDCGAKYRGKVKQSLKGSFSKNSVIDFSSYSLVSLGDTFLIFIAKSGNQVEHLASTNTFSQRIQQKRKTACGEVMPKYHVIHGGTAMLKTYYSPIPNSKPSFVVYGPVFIPKNIKSYFISNNNRPDKCKIYSKCLRVEKESLFKILREIK